MKNQLKKYVLPILLVAFGFSNVWGQDFNTIKQAIQVGNSGELAKFLDDNVEITIPDDEASYSKSQAQMVLKDFFSNHKPASFEIIHTGTSPEGLKYGIGDFHTAGVTFRTYIVVNQGGKITELRFEED